MGQESLPPVSGDILKQLHDENGSRQAALKRALKGVADFSTSPAELSALRASFGELADKAVALAEKAADEPAIALKALLLAAECREAQGEYAGEYALERRAAVLAREANLSDEAIQYFLDRGKVSMRRKEQGYVHARRIFDLVASEFKGHPRAAEASYRLAVCELRLERTDAAIETFGRLIASGTENEPWRREALMTYMHEISQQVVPLEYAKRLSKIADSCPDPAFAALCRLWAGAALVRTAEHGGGLLLLQKARPDLSSDVERSLCELYLMMAEGHFQP